MRVMKSCTVSKSILSNHPTLPTTLVYITNAKCELQKNSQEIYVAKAPSDMPLPEKEDIYSRKLDRNKITLSRATNKETRTIHNKRQEKEKKAGGG